MSQDNGTALGESSADDGDLGEPIAELQHLSIALDERFARRVRGAIERRLLAGEMLSLAWTAPIAALLELLRAPFELLAGRRRP
jgi:hypothetical protein